MKAIHTLVVELNPTFILADLRALIDDVRGFEDEATVEVKIRNRQAVITIVNREESL